MTTPSKRSNRMMVEKPEQLETLASPVRQEIIDTLEVLGPSSVAELAVAVGLSADALYFHLRRLEAVDLVLQTKRQINGRGIAQYSLPGPKLQLRYDYEDSVRPRLVRKIVASMLRTASRDFDAGYDHPDAVITDDARNLWAGRTKAWLSQEQIVEVNDLINELLEVLLRGSREEGAILCALTWALAPVEARPARRGE